MQVKQYNIDVHLIWIGSTEVGGMAPVDRVIVPAYRVDIFDDPKHMFNYEVILYIEFDKSKAALP